MWLCATAVRKLAIEIDGAVETQATIVIDVDVKGLEICRGVDDANIAGLDEVVRNNNVLLVRRDLDVVRADRGLVLIRVIETLNVVQIGDVERRNVVGGGKSDYDGALAVNHSD